MSRGRRFFARVMLPIFIISMTSCGGGGGGGRTVPDNFNDLSKVMNNQSKTLTNSMKDFAEKYNAAIMFDPTTATGEDIVKPLNDLIAAAEVLQDDLEFYSDLLDAYDVKLAGGTAKGIGVAKQSADPLLILDLANLIKQGKKEADAINELIKQGKDPLEVQDAYNEYVKKNMASSFNTGVTAIVGGGAGVIAGLATAAAGAPVLVVTGAAIGTGIIVGAIWSWCTSSSTKSLIKSDTDAPICSMASAQSEVIQINGQNVVAIALPQGGPGPLCLHVDGKAPLCFETTIDKDGNTIVAGCFESDNSDNPSGAAKCEDDTTSEEGITITGTDCSAVSSITASGTGSSTGGFVTATVIPPTQGCTVTYSLVGTDGYTQSGTLTTNASGQIGYTVPAAQVGVYDQSDLTVVESGASTRVGYTF